MKFNTFMARLGFAYYGNPYDDPALKGAQDESEWWCGLSCNNGIFLDLTYVQRLTRDVNFPYRLADKANSFADIRNSNATVLLTFGVKF